MKKENKYHTIKLYQDELLILVNILNHFSDYVSGDDRIDHGWNKLKDWRDAGSDTKRMLYQLNARLARLLRK
jgi:hypothetical protein